MVGNGFTDGFCSRYGVFGKFPGFLGMVSAAHMGAQYTFTWSVQMIRTFVQGHSRCQGIYNILPSPVLFQQTTCSTSQTSFFVCQSYYPHVLADDISYLTRYKFLLPVQLQSKASP